MLDTFTFPSVVRLGLEFRNKSLQPTQSAKVFNVVPTDCQPTFGAFRFRFKNHYGKEKNLSKNNLGWNA